MARQERTQAAPARLAPAGSTWALAKRLLQLKALVAGTLVALLVLVLLCLQFYAHPERVGDSYGPFQSFIYFARLLANAWALLLAATLYGERLNAERRAFEARLPLPPRFNLLWRQVLPYTAMLLGTLLNTGLALVLRGYQYRVLLGSAPSNAKLPNFSQQLAANFLANNSVASILFYFFMTWVLSMLIFAVFRLVSRSGSAKFLLALLFSAYFFSLWTSLFTARRGVEKGAAELSWVLMALLAIVLSVLIFLPEPVLERLRLWGRKSSRQDAAALSAVGPTPVGARARGRRFGSAENRLHFKRIWPWLGAYFVVQTYIYAVGSLAFHSNDGVHFDYNIGLSIGLAILWPTLLALPLLLLLWKMLSLCWESSQPTASGALANLLPLPPSLRFRSQMAFFAKVWSAACAIGYLAGLVLQVLTIAFRLSWSAVRWSELFVNDYLALALWHWTVGLILALALGRRLTLRASFGRTVGLYVLDQLLLAAALIFLTMLMRSALPLATLQLPIGGEADGTTVLSLFLVPLAGFFELPFFSIDSSVLLLLLPALLFYYWRWQRSLPLMDAHLEPSGKGLRALVLAQLRARRWRVALTILTAGLLLNYLLDAFLRLFRSAEAGPSWAAVLIGTALILVLLLGLVGLAMRLRGPRLREAGLKASSEFFWPALPAIFILLIVFALARSGWGNMELRYYQTADLTRPVLDAGGSRFQLQLSMEEEEAYRQAILKQLGDFGALSLPRDNFSADRLSEARTKRIAALFHDPAKRPFERVDWRYHDGPLAFKQELLLTEDQPLYVFLSQDPLLALSQFQGQHSYEVKGLKVLETGATGASEEPTPEQRALLAKMAESVNWTFNGVEESKQQAPEGLWSLDRVEPLYDALAKDYLSLSPAERVTLAQTAPLRLQLTLGGEGLKRIELPLSAKLPHFWTALAKAGQMAETAQPDLAPAVSDAPAR